MNEDLQKKISKWLTTQGYPLEMAVASALRKEGFDVDQGSYYTDPETGTSREIDIVATKGDPVGFLEVSVIVECKTSVEKPWVLFTADDHEAGRNKLFTFGILSDLAREKLAKLSFAPTVLKERIKLNWYDKPQRTGFGITSAFSSGEDAAYKAIVGALKASIHYNQPQKYNYLRPLRFIFPVVVFSGRLFEAYLGFDEELVTEEVGEGFLTNHRFISASYCSSVHIVTEKCLAKFCKEASDLTDQLQILLKQELENMLEELRKPD